MLGDLPNPGYDVEMIQEFLTHLMWELRTNHLEHRSPGPLNPELSDMLGKYIKKRNTTGLLFATMLKNDVTEETQERFRQSRTKLRSAQIRCLEALNYLFQEALAVAGNPTSFNVLSLGQNDV
jgi:hypothetical protein